MPHAAHVPTALLATALGFVLVIALAPPGAAGATSDTAWDMRGCHGAATLALAPLDRVQASLPEGYRAQSAANFLLPGGSPLPSATGDQGLVGVEIWKCDTVTLGGVTVHNAVYGSAAAVVEAPAGAPAASLYFYKYENFFSSSSLVAQSERLGAPAKLVTGAQVEPTLAGARATLDLADGGRYTVTTADLGDMGPGNFQEWHNGAKGVSNWHAGFTVNPGKQGTGDLAAPAGSKAAQVMGATSGSGLGIHTTSDFSGGVRLTA